MGLSQTRRLSLTTHDRIRTAVCAALDRHKGFLNTEDTGLRSVAIVVKLTPNGELRAIIFTPEVEHTPERVPPTMARRA